jgi:hypothetical protein
MYIRYSGQGITFTVTGALAASSSKDQEEQREKSEHASDVNNNLAALDTLCFRRWAGKSHPPNPISSIAQRKTARRRLVKFN